MSVLSFETERTRLRPTTREDASFLLKLMNTPKWIDFIGDRKIKTIEDAEHYISVKMIPQLNRLGYSNYTVIRKSDEAKMGTCGLYDRDEIDGVDIGFAFLPEFEKKGYAFESASRLLRAGFEDFVLEEIFAITIERNSDSKKLLRKLGLRHVKKMRLKDDPEELLLFRISKEQNST